MRLHLDAQALQGPFYERGIARYVASLIRALRTMEAPIAGISLHPTEPDVHPIYQDIASDPATARSSVARWRELLGTGPLVHVCMSAFEGFRPIQNLWPSFVLDSDVALAAIVYDTIPLRYPAEFQDTRERRGFYDSRARLLSHADRFLVISESSGRDLVEDLGVEPAQVRCIGTGVDERFRPAIDGGDAARQLVHTTLPSIRRPFVLDVAGWPATKNVIGLLTAWAQLDREIRGRFQLVLACRVPPETEQSWRATMHALRIDDDEVVITGFVPDQLLVALYQCADLLVCPSLHEGFGLPVAEAAACGCPAICSNTSSLPEVLDWPAATFDPRDASQVAASITRALTDTTWREELRRVGAEAAQRHRWDTVASRFVAGLGNIERVPYLPPRCRVALLADGRVPDEVVAAARSELDRRGGPEYAQVDVFGSKPPAGEPDSGIRWFPRTAFGRTLPESAYDHVEAVLRAPESAPR